MATQKKMLKAALVKLALEHLTSAGPGGTANEDGVGGAEGEPAPKKKRKAAQSKEAEARAPQSADKPAPKKKRKAAALVEQAKVKLEEERAEAEAAAEAAAKEQAEAEAASARKLQSQARLAELQRREALDDERRRQRSGQRPGGAVRASRRGSVGLVKAELEIGPEGPKHPPTTFSVGERL